MRFPKKQETQHQEIRTAGAYKYVGASGIMIGGQLGLGNLKKAKAYGSRFVKLFIWSGVASGIFSSGGDSKFGLICNTITMWVIVVPIGLISAFVLKLPVTLVYILINIDEIIKLPAVYQNYKKYRWVKNLTKSERSCSAV